MPQRRQQPVSQPQRTAPVRRKKRRSRAPVILLAVVLLFGLSAMLAVFALRSATDLLGLNQEDRDVDIVVEQGMSVSEITKLLHAKGIVTQPLTFRAYARFRGGSALQAGEYVLNCNMSYDQILGILRRGDVVRNEIRITFYEGMTMREIARTLEENGVCDEEEFIEYVESSEFEYEFCALIPEKELRFRKMEGYLFPDTYDFYQGELVASVAKKFLRAFSANVYTPLYDEIREAGMTLDEAVTLASIIQKEASSEEEMKTVSSVFQNRLRNPSAGLPMLESDVTIFYVRDDIQSYQERQTKEIYDAYNTYECRGLPIGPICSPGVAAIEAAIHPADTNYYFFVTDAEGEYYYASTFDQHKVNVSQASRVGIKHGTDVSDLS